jgi:hypothetical protein
MIVLLDRNFGAKARIAAIDQTGADVFVRRKNGRRMPDLARYRDGSYLSLLGGVKVRVIDAEITVTTATGRHTAAFTGRPPPCSTTRGIQRSSSTTSGKKIETAYLQITSTILGGRVLRARTPAGVVPRSTLCWSLTSCCAPSWRTPPTPDPTSTRTAPASPSPSRPRASSPAPSSTWSAPSAA